MSNERIDLTQFEGHGFREVITQNRHEYEEGFPPATVEVDIPEGIAFAPPPLDEKLVSWSGYKVWMSGKDANVIQHIDSLIAELKRCYEREDELLAALRIIRDDLDEEIAKAHFPNDKVAWQIRNFAHDASQ